MDVFRKHLVALAIALSVIWFPNLSWAQAITVGSQCSMPGPIADNKCTVMYRVDNNPGGIVCTWIKEINGLYECQGTSRWGNGYNDIVAPGRTLEFRRHSDWPTNHPSWPSNPAAVRASGTLLKSQYVATRYRASPTTSCKVTVATGQSIQAAINSAGINATVCLASGLHQVASTIKPKAGQTIRSASASSLATVRGTTSQYVFTIEVADVTLKDFRIEGTSAARPTFGVLASGASAKNILVDRVRISGTLTGLGTTNSASNVELRQSEIYFTGDGQACTGCQNPAIWINSSSDIRIMKSLLINNGASPEGDGELACYNSPRLVVHNTTVNNSGAAGMYLVNCDYAVVAGNDIISAGEWGLDVVDADQPSGSDYGLFSLNLIEGSRHGAGVVKDSHYNTFIQNTYNNNRQGPNASGSCNGINRRGNTMGYYYLNDVASPWPVVCND